jgi:hypothetical protein
VDAIEQRDGHQLLCHVLFVRHDSSVSRELPRWAHRLELGWRWYSDVEFVRFMRSMRRRRKPRLLRQQVRDPPPPLGGPLASSPGVVGAPPQQQPLPTQPPLIITTTIMIIIAFTSQRHHIYHHSPLTTHHLPSLTTSHYHKGRAPKRNVSVQHDDCPSALDNRCGSHLVAGRGISSGQLRCRNHQQNNSHVLLHVAGSDPGLERTVGCTVEL